MCVCECVYVFAVLVSVLTLGIEHKHTGNMMYVEHYAASTFRESIVSSFFFLRNTPSFAQFSSLLVLTVSAIGVFVIAVSFFFTSF